MLHKDVSSDLLSETSLPHYVWLLETMLLKEGLIESSSSDSSNAHNIDIAKDANN